MEQLEKFGFLNINKPKGMTSHDVVYFVRKMLGIKQVGHSGTLDPMAEGVLVVGVGKATRLFEFLKEEKEYIATIKFGYESDTLDTDGECVKKEDFFPDETKLKTVLNEFLGESEQIPPKYSAIKIGGKKLYEMARKGQEIGEIKARPIKIKKIELLEIDENEAKIKVGCSKGTYVRSLIRDIAQKLGTVAVMSALTRTKSGAFEIENSIEIGEFCEKEDLTSSLINPLDVMDYPQYEINEEDLKAVKNGAFIKASEEFKQNEIVLLTYEGQIASIAQIIGKNAVQKKGLL
ncbi:tRNA pseudouridine(55) synthase TruB [bacterium]|nr:tRNA pseudouridine(55) synthase TruB [bacterium]